MKLNELGLDRHQTKKVLSKYNDLKIQAMMFDMDIDIETWSLVEKQTYKKPDWLSKWENNNRNGDYAGSPEQGWA